MLSNVKFSDVTETKQNSIADVEVNDLRQWCE